MNDQVSEEDKPNRKPLILSLTGLGLFLSAVVVLLVLYGMGQVSGVEFSPDDFSRRSFSYNQMPWTDWVVVKKVYSDRTTDLEKSLTGDKLIRSVILKKKRWHLISEFGSSLVPDQCDARFLTGYLDKYDKDGNNYWDTWNTDYPKCAKVFWPEVADLARDEMYLKVADVMRVAMSVSEDDPQPFQVELQTVLSDVYLELGTLDIELGEMERAKKRLKTSILHDPDSKAVEKLESIENQTGSSSVSVPTTDPETTAEALAEALDNEAAE